MTRSQTLRLLVPVSLLTLFGCNTGGILGPSASTEVTVQNHADATKVVSVEDSLPKPPRYSPFLIDHKTVSPFASQAPDDESSPTPKPTSNPTPTAGPTPTPNPNGTATPNPNGTATPVAALPIDYGTVKYNATQLAGGGSPGTPTDGTGGSVVFGANAVSVGLAPNFEKDPPEKLGLTDGKANKLRDMVLATSAVAGIVGDGTDAKDDNSLKDPGGLCFNANQKVYYLADTGHHRIGQINGTSNALTWVAGSGTLAGVPATPTFKDGKGTGVAADQQATFNSPRGLAYAGLTTKLYIADTGFNCIRAMDVSKVPTEITTIAGVGGTSGKPAAADKAEDALTTKFNAPTALALSTDEKTLYVADSGNHCIRAIDLAAGGKVRVLAGSMTADSKDGLGIAATFNGPSALARDKDTLFVGETGTPRVRAIDLATGKVTTVLGLDKAGKADGDKLKAAFTKVTGLATLLGTGGTVSTLFAFDAGDATNGPRLISIKITP